MINYFWSLGKAKKKYYIGFIRYILYTVYCILVFVVVVVCVVGVGVVLFQAHGSDLPGVSLPKLIELSRSLSGAMEKRILDFDYSPDLTMMPKGKLVCLVSTMVSMDEDHNCHRMATVPQGQHFRYKGEIPKGMASHSLLLVMVETEGKMPVIRQTPDSICLSYPHCTLQSSRDLIEFCAGMGALGQGALAAQFVPKVAVELRPNLAKLYASNSSAKVITGDITEFRTIKQVHEALPASATISAGVSCQPYSRLGDGKSGQDSRASTLPATLAAAHYLRAVVIILECVAPAGDDAYVRWQIAEFCKRTNFSRSEIVLDLQDVWPCKRQRWWCVLSAPALGSLDLKPFVPMQDLETIRHVMPQICRWPSYEEKQLQLTPIEAEAFADSKGSPASYCINLKGILPCALHAWGSQLTACPCGCRESGFSSARLVNKGVFGVLAESKSSHDGINEGKFRHLHPIEAAALCGLDPKLVWDSQMRLVLGAIGQLASPLQSCWICLQVQQMLQKAQFGQASVRLCKAFGLYRSWLLARAENVWTETHPKMVPSPTLEQAQLWKPVIGAKIEQLVTPERCIEKCAENIGQICSELMQQNEQSTVDSHFDWLVADLTCSQVAIPSQLDNCESAREEEHRSPTSIVPTNPEDLFDVTLQTHASDPPVVVKVPAGTKVQELLQAEVNLNNQVPQSEANMVVRDAAGVSLSLEDPIHSDIELFLCDPGSFSAEVSSTECKDSTEAGNIEVNGNPKEMEHQPISPLAQVKGPAFLKLIPPSVSSDYQVSSLRAQKILASDRQVILRNQGLIWGDDEIKWHLNRILQTCASDMTEHEIEDELPAQVDPLAFVGWIYNYQDSEIQQWHTTNGEPSVIFTVLLHQGHWIPLIVRFQESIVSLSYLQVLQQDIDIVKHVAVRMQQVFKCDSYAIHPVQCSPVPASCGAAAILFLEEYLLLQPTPAIPDYFEVHNHLRKQFQQEGFESSLVSHPWMWGAGKDETEKAQEELIQVLKAHGVPQDAVKSRAQNAIAAIGASSILQACQSQSPWRTLKALGNQVKFQFVLPSELQIQIAARAGQEAVGQPNKKGKGAKSAKHEAPLDLDPAKLSLPEGLFSCEGAPVNQITSQQIGPVAEGVAIVTALEAEPFLRANKVVSNNPLALLILNAPTARLGTTLMHSPLTVPARCVINQEPLLLEATLVQLGSKKIEKTVTKPHADFDTVKVATLKLVVYRDEVLIPWEQFGQGPVKYILHHLPILKLCQEKHCQCAAWHNTEGIAVQSAVVDVWRRQFLRKGYKPEIQSTACMFSVCLRVPSCLKDKVIDASGTAGIYVEPRSLDAREVDKSFEVVWVPRADRATVTHLKQTNPAATSIVRSDDRWGLRVPVSQAQALHASVRPDAVYLPQGPRLRFTVAPVPYGTDRKSLSKILKAMGWEAKPVQPTGAVEGGRGNVWSVLATEHPPTNIVSMGHGEMVIATVRTPTGEKDDHMKPLATTSTLTLCGNTLKKQGQQDPWTIQDPWQSYQSQKMPSHAASVPDASESLKQLESKIEQAVLARIPAQPVVSMEQDDVPDRVEFLEKQVQSLMHKQQQLEVTVNDQHVHQSAQLSQLQGQLNAQGQQVSNQLASQQQSMQQMFEAQMQQIRGLLSKRPRSEDGE